jgi:hypothetical protein
MDPKQLMEAAEFILKLLKERNNEARSLLNLKALDEAKVLMAEADKLGVAFDVLMATMRKG